MRKTAKRISLSRLAREVMKLEEKMQATRREYYPKKPHMEERLTKKILAPVVARKTGSLDYLDEVADASGDVLFDKNAKLIGIEFIIDTRYNSSRRKYPGEHHHSTFNRVKHMMALAVSRYNYAVSTVMDKLVGERGRRWIFSDIDVDKSGIIRFKIILNLAR